MSAFSRKVIVLVADHDTQNGLQAWAKRQGFDLTLSYSGNQQAAEDFDFHTTLVASANEVFVPETQHVIDPVRVEPAGFDVLGADRRVPALKLAPSPKLEGMREFFVGTYGIQPTFADFKPHVSLSYAWAGVPDLAALPVPDFPLIFDQLRVKTLGAAKAVGAHWCYR